MFFLYWEAGKFTVAATGFQNSNLHLKARILPTATNNVVFLKVTMPLFLKSNATQV